MLANERVKGIKEERAGRRKAETLQNMVTYRWIDKQVDRLKNRQILISYVQMSLIIIGKNQRNHTKK